MVKVSFILPQGGRIEGQGDVGASVMEVGKASGVDGIRAECGGVCACATCHVYIPANWMDAVGEPSEDEKVMLEFSAGLEDNSRLSCQIILSDDLDGLEVEIPESQY